MKRERSEEERLAHEAFLARRRQAEADEEAWKRRRIEAVRDRLDALGIDPDALLDLLDDMRR